MNMTGVSLLGWVHTIACTLALFLGAYTLIRIKGTPRHRMVGRLYVWSMLIASISILGVYHFDIQFVPFRAGPHIFGLFHYETVFTLAMLLLGWYAAPRQRMAFYAYAHPVAMLTTYYMLIGALINEMFVRDAVLHSWAQTQLQDPRLNVAQAPVVGEFQTTALLIFIMVLMWFCGQVALRRRERAIPAAMPAK